LIMFSGLLFAETIHASYKIEYGIFGKMGVSDAYLTKRGDEYEIKALRKTAYQGIHFRPYRQEGRFS